MLVLSDFPWQNRPTYALVTPVSAHRFLELALTGELKAYVGWRTSMALSRLLQVPFPAHEGIPPHPLPSELLVARLGDGRVELYHVIQEVI